MTKLTKPVETNMKEPRLPIVGEYVRGQGTLVAVNHATPLPPPPQQEDYIFEEQSARCEVRLNGEVIKTITELNDFYGLGTGVTGAIEEMQAWAKARNLGPQSELEVVVVKVISQVRRQLKDAANFYDETYRDFDALPIGCKRDLPDDVETVVWSSKTVTDARAKEP